MPDDAMFAQLMAESPEPQRAKRIPVATKASEGPDTANAARQSRAQDDLLPLRLEDLSEVGYNSHSYRFTDAEIRWLRRFCLRLSEAVDQPVAHNTLIRTLFRLADSEWRASPEDNRILDLLTKLLR